jgi:hypothetical protein
MSQNDDITKLERKLERRAYLTYHQDGLLDIAFGIGILGVGLMFLTDGSLGFFLSWLPFVLYLPFKRLVTVPRLGYVEFRRQKTGKGIFFLLGLVLLLAIFVGGILMLSALSLRRGPLVEPGQSIDQYVWMAVSGIGAVIAAGAVLALRLRRLMVYASLSTIMVVAGYLLDLNPAVYLLILGAVVLITGLVMLIRFLHKYPSIDGAIDGEGNHATG